MLTMLLTDDELCYLWEVERCDCVREVRWGILLKGRYVKDVGPVTLNKKGFVVV